MNPCGPKTHDLDGVDHAHFLRCIRLRRRRLDSELLEIGRPVSCAGRKYQLRMHQSRPTMPNALFRKGSLRSSFQPG